MAVMAVAVVGEGDVTLKEAAEFIYSILKIPRF